MSVGLPTSSRFDAPSLQPLVRQGAPVAMHPFDAAAGITDAVRLDLNESILTLTPTMRQRMGEVAATASLVGYPDGACTALRDAAARFFDVRHRDCLAVGNGADDLIGRLCATFGQPRPGRQQGRVLVPEMSFEAYKMAATANGMAVDTFCFEPGFRPDMAMLESAIGRTRPNLVFLATPNNPTGQTIDPEAMKAVLKRHPDVLFVLDEAYIAYSSSESLADAVVATPDADVVAAHVAIIADELNVKNITLTTDVTAYGTESLVLHPKALGPRLGGSTQQVIAAHKAGDWTADNGTVTVGGVELMPGEFDFVLVSAADGPAAPPNLCHSSLSTSSTLLPAIRLAFSRETSHTTLSSLSFPSFVSSS